jgi:hypothetical protein
MASGCRAEGKLICDVLVRDMPKVWEGQASVLELQRADYNWRQMEWIGWYNEMKVRQVVRSSLGGEDGPRYGNTAFDYRRECVWDFKVHPEGDPWTILNDQEAVDSCIHDHGSLGFVVTLGGADYNDAAGTFKRWHDQLKGETSGYERERIARGARSRRRKVRFRVAAFVAFVFEGSVVPEAGLGEGWLTEFQKGMRNADGSPRRPKYKINVDQIPPGIIVAQVRV